MFTEELSESVGVGEVELFEHFLSLKGYLLFRSGLQLHDVLIWVLLDVLYLLGLILPLDSLHLDGIDLLFNPLFPSVAVHVGSGNVD